MPRTAIAFAQAEFEQQLQVIVIVRRRAAWSAVVHRLAVVRVGTGFEQDPGQLKAILVWRLVAFASAEGAGQCGEGRWQALPQVPGIRVGAVGQQQSSDLQWRLGRYRKT